MLSQLTIKNLALIDELTIKFDEGLNILTGETGAGKSIIIDAVNLVLGERADRELIQSGKKYAWVEGIFYIAENHGIISVLNKYGIDSEEDGCLILNRELSLNGKNICRINGRSVTLSTLKEISHFLVDIHGQHQHQSLLAVDTHLNMLDRLGGKTIARKKEQVANLYKIWRSTQEEIRKLIGFEKSFEQKKDFLLYQIDEITKANLKVEEEEELKKERLLIQNTAKITETLHNAYDALYSGSSGKQSIFDQIGEISYQISQIAHLDHRFNQIYQQLDNLFYQAEDIILNLRSFKDQFEYDPLRLDDIEKRLESIQVMKRKYGSTIKDILDFKNNAEKELNDISGLQEKLSCLTEKEKRYFNELISSCISLSNERHNLSKFFKEQIQNQLAELGMSQTRFEVAFHTPSGQNPSEIPAELVTVQGYDIVEFMISPNPGEPLKPLAKIASGGEMSRIMLAFKTILAQVDEIPTLIFDEIDVGISGRIAGVLAEKMGILSRSHQIICVTHLPQIASMADTHFSISKTVHGERTRTTVKKIDHLDRREELSRMLSGINVSKLGLAHAAELIDSAEEFKKRL
jgi:DNA repair protein RecN (Recombination protein N)